MYYRPDKINEALDSLSREKLTIAAGCTDLLPSTQQDNLGDNILDISGIKSLRNIDFENGFRRIGSGVTWTDIVENNNLPNCYNASPAADGVPCLLSLDASIELLSVNGKRVLKLEDFIKGSRKTELQNNEILSAILIPKEAEIGRSSFLKLGARKYLVISIAMIACKLNLEKDIISDIAISVGSCSAVAKRIKSLENLLIGKSIKDELTTIILNYNYKNYLSPINDIRGTNTYRLKASKVLVKDTIIKTINKFNLKD